MRQLVLPGDRSRDTTFLPQGRLLRYLGRVLRMKPGDSFPAIDEAGNMFDCVVREGPDKGIELALTPGRPRQRRRGRRCRRDRSRNRG